MLEDPTLSEFRVKTLSAERIVSVSEGEAAYALDKVSHGEFATMEKAFQKMKSIKSTSTTLGFEIDMQCDFWPYELKTYNAHKSLNAKYDFGEHSPKGKRQLLDRTYCSDLERDWRNEFGRFRGRPDGLSRFKDGEIVEVLYGDEIRLAVIDGTVRTVEDIWTQSVGKQKRLSTYTEGVEGLTDEEIAHYDSSDDTVWIIFGPRYFNGDDDWVHVLDIMPLRYPLSKELRARYEGWYKAMRAERKLLSKEF